MSFIRNKGPTQIRTHERKALPGSILPRVPRDHSLSSGLYRRLRSCTGSADPSAAMAKGARGLGQCPYRRWGLSPRPENGKIRKSKTAPLQGRPKCKKGPAKPDPQKPRHPRRRIAVAMGAEREGDQPLTESFRPLPGVNFGTLRAGISTSAPVDGLRPFVAAR